MFHLRCPDCQAFTPLWRDVAVQLKDVVTVADLDCAVQEKTCESLEIDNYPTFISSANGEILGRMARTRTVEQMVKYGKKKFTVRKSKSEAIDEPKGVPNDIQEISSSNFSSTIATGTTLVVFCVPWCKYCQNITKTLNELKPELDDNIKMKRMNCNHKDNADICFNEVTNGVPTMNLYCNGSVVLKDYEESTAEELKDMLKSGCGDAHDLTKWKAREEQRKNFGKTKSRKQSSSSAVNV